MVKRRTRERRDRFSGEPIVTVSMMLPRNAIRAIATLMATSITPVAAQRSAVDAKIDSLIARMTLTEKLGQLNLLSVNGRPSPEQLDLVRQGKVGGFFNL